MRFFDCFLIRYSLVDWISEIMKEHEKTCDEKNLRDFINAFITEKRKGNNSTFTVRKNIFPILNSIFNNAIGHFCSHTMIF